MPRGGDSVTIPNGLSVTLDVSPPALAGLTVNGHLIFDRQDLRLTSDWIMIHGRLEVGTPEQPFTNRAEIVLTGEDATQNIMGMGAKVLGVMEGGVLELHGEQRNGWTKLAATAARGSSQIAVVDATDWRAGDEIALASTDFDHRQAERRRIVAVSNNTLTLDRPLDYMHFGAITHGIDQRGEVGLLSRNLRVRGETTAERGFGGHIMVMHRAWARVSGVELFQMGQRGGFGRYPIHWHMAGDVPGQYFERSSVHSSFNRCVTIHGTNWLRVAGNVAYNALGHCYFLEDGAEMGNTLEGNLGFLTLAPPRGQEIIPSDSTPATFWITNPYNFLRGNVAAGSADTGIWYALPTNPTGPSKTTRIWPRRTPLGEFADNVAHSNGTFGLMVDRGPNGQGQGGQAGLESAGLEARVNPVPPAPGSPDAPAVSSVFRQFLAYKNRTGGAWLRGAGLTVIESQFSDNSIGITFAARESALEDSLMVGDSDNLGQPPVSQLRGADGRSLPRPFRPESARFAVRGFEFYDGRVGFRNVRFVNFQPLRLTDGTVREAAAASYLQFTPWQIDSRNFAQGARLENAKPVYFAPHGEPTPDQLAKDDSADSYRSAVILDTDGSLTGQPGSSVVVDEPILIDDNCQARPEWNAQVCANRYGRLNVANLGQAAPIAPLTLTRLEAARPQFRMWGTPSPGENTRFSATVAVGRSYDLGLSGALPSRLRLSLNNRHPGDWLTISLLVSQSAVLYQDGLLSARYRLKPVGSLQELHSAGQTAYFHDGAAVHLKLVLDTGRDWAGVDICQTELCR